MSGKNCNKNECDETISSSSKRVFADPWKKSLFGLLILPGALLMTGCDVDVRDEGELPDIDVEATEGRMPDVDVRGPDVDVGTKEKTITVPDIDVDIPEENENEVDAKNDGE
ncbi:hypothetical protein Pla110_41430 [Polystyrenella longa]|uniref:Uncharacterized protein n=1 Tax=Polystyrenella longa TaxID=2528007 RepID=A0A518CT32_9PLAN|nr:hypothetical protein [Polystyrenella longa]QDU82388.1 hypothetical protein Pla110_41430 [Polystyrenella longa]